MKKKKNTKSESKLEIMRKTAIFFSMYYTIRVLNTVFIFYNQNVGLEWKIIRENNINIHVEYVTCLVVRGCPTSCSIVV